MPESKMWVRGSISWAAARGVFQGWSVRSMKVGESPAGISRANILGQRISQLHDLLKEERGKKEAVSKHRRVRSETRWLRALRDCENSHNMEIKAQMMIAAQRIADEKYI